MSLSNDQGEAVGIEEQQRGCYIYLLLLLQMMMMIMIMISLLLEYLLSLDTVCRVAPRRIHTCMMYLCGGGGTVDDG